MNNRLAIFLLLAAMAGIALMLPEFAYIAIGAGAFLILKTIGSVTSSKRKIKVYAYSISKGKRAVNAQELVSKLKTEAKVRAIEVGELCMEFGIEGGRANVEKVEAVLKDKWRKGELEFHSGYICTGKSHREKIAAKCIYNRLLLSGKLIEGSSRQILKKYNAFLDVEALANAWNDRRQATLFAFSKIQKRRAIASLLLPDMMHAKALLMFLYGYAVVECI